MSNRSRAFALILASCSLPVQAMATTAQGSDKAVGTGEWISHPQNLERPIVLQFRRAIDLAVVPPSFPIHVSADNAFTLYVNGQRVVSGPSTSDAAHWRYTSTDLAPFLRKGENVITATVWNFVKPKAPVGADATPDEQQRAWVQEMLSQTGRFAQQSVDTGFWLEGQGAAAQIATSRGGWAVAVDPMHVPAAGPRQVGLQRYYVAGAPEVIDTRLSLPQGPGTGTSPGLWMDAVAAPSARRMLVADPLPRQRFASAPSGKVVRSTFAPANQFPAQPVSIPAHAKATFLVQRDAMISAYPELLLDGGKDAKIRMTYSEAPYDKAGRKGDRDDIEGRQFIGIYDDIIANGHRQSITPLWWRTWRYLEISVETADAPLTLEGLKTWETGYPFEEKGYFHSSDPELNRIWQIGWRTALVDAHDTYMDSSYWEQLQYVGDTRLQMLISYAVSGDPRLAGQAIDAFAASDVDNGLIEGAWPSRGTNAIAPFSLLWVGMLHDWMAEQPDRTMIVRNLPRMRKVIGWFEAWQSRNGLLRKNPQWNFVDWVGQDAGDRTRFPSYGKEDGESCLTSILYLGALDQAAGLEKAFGSAANGKRNTAQAASLRKALRARCYSPQKQLFADNPDLAVFSQQMNALAVLYDVATPQEAPGLLDRIVAPGKGIDAPTGMYTTSYYFAWYLVRAFEHAGQAERYGELLKTWRDLLKLNYTTWPEERENTRSDSHAWSAHPTADLLRIVAGIGPGGQGYSKLRIAPALGSLTKLDAAAMTPQGLVSVRYRVEGGKLHATVTKPKALEGWFEWNGKRYPLATENSQYTLEQRPAAK